MTKDKVRSTEEALKLALEALENIDRWLPTIGQKGLRDYEADAITAIKEALANEALEKMAENARELGLDYEPAQQEPVGEIVDAIEGAFKCSFTKMLPVGTKLYTTPPQRTWVGLTLDERIELAQDVDWAIGAYCEYAEKIEAKLKEKNT